MKVIFLDFDGVLVTADYQRRNGGARLDPTKVMLMAAILRDNDARVVVSSSWRGNVTTMRTTLERFGLINARKWVIGVTPHISNAIRGEEIQAWLAKHPETTSFCILDDDADMGDLLPRLVRTDWWAGLEERHKAQIEEALA